MIFVPFGLFLAQKLSFFFSLYYKDLYKFNFNPIMQLMNIALSFYSCFFVCFVICYIYKYMNRKVYLLYLYDVNMDYWIAK